jgi:Ca2+-binding EF-hand superfamily protein
VSVIESYLAYTSTTSLKFHEYSQMFSVLDSNSDGYIERQELETAF